MISGGSSPQGVPGVGKKADAVADRSGVPLLYNHACLYRSLPPRRERRHAFPGSRTRRRHLAGRVPRAKRLGRSKRSEIPVQETCTRREVAFSVLFRSEDCKNAREMLYFFYDNINVRMRGNDFRL